MKGDVIWFTGLSGAGKSTIAEALKDRLEAAGKKMYIIDGDVIRATIHKHLGFSREDIRENNRLIAELAIEKAKENDFILVPIVAPYNGDREMARSKIGKNFILLYVNASLDQCIKRDVKGFYKKALAGEIKDFFGIAKSNPYEAPKSPDIEVKTDKNSLESCVEKVLEFLKKRKLL